VNLLRSAMLLSEQPDVRSLAVHWVCVAALIEMVWSVHGSARVSRRQP